MEFGGLGCSGHFGVFWRHNDWAEVSKVCDSASGRMKPNPERLCMSKPKHRSISESREGSGDNRLSLGFLGAWALRALGLV